MKLGDREFRVRARVARVQEPSWMDVAGVAVEFADLCDATEAELVEAIQEAGLSSA